MITRTIRGFKEEQKEMASLLPLFRDLSDMDFAKTLLRKTILNAEDYTEYIEDAASNWELDRIADIDRIIMTLAIIEAVEFDNIPTKVTLNEYIEIAKLFSTRKSFKFINGILDNVFEKLKMDKKIVKKGRGLIGEIETLNSKE